MMSPRLRFHHTQGQSVVLVALALLVLMGVAGLGLDGANAFNQRRNVANAADAAAMAGTNALILQRQSGSGSNTPVCQAVSDYINNHGLNGGVALTWTASYVDSSATPIGTPFCDSAASPVATSGFATSSARGISVTIQYTFRTLFMPVLGRSDLSASGTATAMYGPVSSIIGGDVVPFAVSQNVANQIVGTTAPFDITIDKLNAGDFGSVGFNPSDPNNGNGHDCDSLTYADTQTYYWCNGSPKYPVSIGEDLPGNTGMVSNDLHDEVGTRLDKVIVMPVFGSLQGTGSNTTFSIVGFISIRLNSFDLTGSDAGFHVTYVSYTTTAGAFSNGAIDGGVYALNLVK